MVVSSELIEDRQTEDIVMPYREPDPDDPLEYRRVAVPIESVKMLEDRVACFCEEFMKLGYGKEEIYALFTNPFYSATHELSIRLGEDRILELLEQTLGKFSNPRND